MGYAGLQGSAPVKVDKLTGTDGFVVIDLDDAVTSVGIVRLAPKVLRDGAQLLARSVTYAFASFGLAGHGGASGAVNARPDGRDEAIAAFTEEVRPRAEAGALVLAPGTGLTASDLAPLGWSEPDADLTAAGALAAGRVAGPHDWRTAAVVGSGPVADAAVAQLTKADATLADARLDAPCDVLFVAGKAGVLDHSAAATVQARTIVPLTPVPVTARALAVLGRAERVVIPDFLATAAPLLATFDPDGGDPVQRVHTAVTDLAEHGTGLWLAAAKRAEENLATWTAEKPFGRPLA
jgi:glutamate dehydrogenase/leucine dehydrogenase